MVAEVPLPDTVAPLWIIAIVQLPVPGSPLRTTEPLASSHVGWVISPDSGADGVGGCSLITICAEGSEVQPSPFETV